ncbi:hypothetical protein EUX98_g2035 [Antrodiella citrinella]|uniref:LIM interaction domain-containing protein n=1 Tax=Antrodiella citrinella TaxID=2447956 RepID=A0A4S4N2X3_9APHY|nr:hypothetical protein EUX98_g2035 [Antrodiella citrinella]
MNSRPDIFRHNSMNHLSQGNILTMNTPHLFPQQQQQQQPSQLGQQQQQPAPPPHMGLLQPGPASNPSLGLLPTGQPSGASNQAAVYQLQMQQANHQRRQQQMHQAMSAQAMGGQNASGHTPSGTSPSSMQTPPTPTQSAQVPNRPLTGVPAPTAAAATPPSASQTSDNSLLQTVVQAGPSIAPQRMLGNMTYPVGFGQGLTRLLQFSGVLASDTPNKLQLSYWDSLIKEYFTPKASLKFTLWKDNQRNEAKPFEIGVPILPRFFLVTSQSGVKSMNLSLDGARERIVSHGHAVVECVHAVWTYRYTNGYTVTLRGPMTAHIFVLPNHTSTGQAPHQHVSYTLKFDQLQFDANYHDKLIAMEAISGSRTTESPRLKAPSTPVMNGIRRPEDEDRRFEEPRLVIEKAVIPAEPVNAFGIPQATMRCLELAESVAQMSPLIQFSTENKLGPLDALTQYARKLRDIQGPGINGAPGAHGFSPSSSSAFENGGTGVPATPPVTLYPGTPMSSGSQTLSSANIPTPSGPSASDTVSKQNKASSSMPQPPATPTAGPANASTPVSAPTPTAVTTTPSLTHSTLKRKAQGQAGEGSASANTTPEVPPPKRVNRKRGRTGG